MLNPGRYTARAVEAALGKTNGGKPQVAVLFEVTQGDHIGEQITWYGYFTDKTEQRTYESLTACGWTGDNLATLDGIDTEEVSLVVKHEPHFETGEMQAKVQWVNKLGAGALQMKARMDDGEALAFAQRMRGNVLAYRKNGGAPKPVAPKPAATPPHRVSDNAGGGAAEDDLPF